tara:strand:+ start:739 stop:1113 length:375 start_codon:yes stop_codon:yes gene_type:complete
MVEFLWFLGGAISFQLLSKLLRLGHSSLLLQDLQVNVMKFLVSVVEEISFIHSLKYKIMRKAEVSEREIKAMKLLDQHEYDLWKSEIVKKINKSVSPMLSSNLSIKSWENIINYLDGCYDQEKE